MKLSKLTKAALILLTLTATVFAQAQVSPEDYEREQGRMEAAAYNQVIEMKKELDVIVKKIGDLQDQVGFESKASQDDAGEKESPGLVKALGEKLDMTDHLSTELVATAVEMQKQSGDELFKSYDKAAALVKQARKNLADSKKLAAGN